MIIAGRTFRLLGKAEVVFVGNSEEKVTLFRPEWIDVEYDGVTLVVGKNTLQARNSFYEDQYAAGFWHKKASKALEHICRAELSLSPSEYTYTKLNGFEFVFLIKNQFAALQFKMIVAEL